MIKLIIYIIVIGCICFLFNAIKNSFNSDSKIGGGEEVPRHTFTYAGGWNELSEVRDIKAYIYPEYLYLRTENKAIEKAGFVLPSMRVPYNKIKNVSIKMQTEVQQNATLGKILLIGIFAFAKKKRNVTFLVLDYVDEFNSEQSLILLGENFQPFMQNLNSRRRECVNG